MGESSVPPEAGSDAVELRPLAPGDLDDVLELNQRSTPEVGEVDRARLASIVASASLSLVARDGHGGLAGFVIVLGPGAAYDSPNYLHFAATYPDFRYVDRIAIDPRAQGVGLGRRLYRAVVEHARAAGSPVVLAEVNLEPPNPVSLAFHAALGFTEVGTQSNYGGTTVVQFLALEL
ncbi:MAG: GNAT family N-acetyltransferase [Microthrixaceae bacterium]